MRGCRTRSRADLQFNVKRQSVAQSSGGSVAETSGAFLTKKPHSDPRMESCQSGRKPTGGVASASVTDSKKKGSHGG